MRLTVYPAPSPAPESGPRSIQAVKVLRISVTDRCNFRCVYCMPEDGVKWLPREEILSYEEIAEVVRAAIEIHDIRRFKLTGGEPTVRANLLELVAMLRKIPGIEDLSMTTNGFALEHLAYALKEAGLDRVTVSIDSLRAERFRKITRTGDLAAVLRGLDRCEEIELPVKINCVAMRGTNDDEFTEFAKLTLRKNLTVRFIEYMPLGDAAIMQIEKSARPQPAGPAQGCGGQERGDVFIAESEIRAVMERELGELISIDRHTESGVGPAVPYRLPGAVGRIGFISAMSQPFCETCNRLRLTADGTLRSCLFEGGEVDVRSILRSDAPPYRRQQLLGEAMTDCVRLKPVVHSGHGNRQMSQMGG